MVYITAIHLVGGSQNEHIAAVRWRNPESGQTGSSTKQVMVDWIEQEKGDARVQGSPRDSQVGVVNATPKYLRTYADGQWNNNLLALPQY